MVTVWLHIVLHGYCMYALLYVWLHMLLHGYCTYPWMDGCRITYNLTCSPQAFMYTRYICIRVHYDIQNLIICMHTCICYSESYYLYVYMHEIYIVSYTQQYMRPYVVLPATHWPSYFSTISPSGDIYTTTPCANMKHKCMYVLKMHVCVLIWSRNACMCEKSMYVFKNACMCTNMK
jgi:hypothetical protein